MTHYTVIGRVAHSSNGTRLGYIGCVADESKGMTAREFDLVQSFPQATPAAALHDGRKLLEQLFNQVLA